jgi:hypothetical protein
VAEGRLQHGKETHYMPSKNNSERRKTESFEKKAINLDICRPYRIKIARDIIDYVYILKRNGLCTAKVKQRLKKAETEFRYLFERITK